MEQKFKPGQLIWCVEISEEYPEDAELSGYLYMAECKDYIICCSNYVHCMGDFDHQLSEMYKESIDEYSTSVVIIKKDFVFENKEVAKVFLEEFLNNL